MKPLLTLTILFVINLLQAQVGINTNNPKVTLHIEGNPTNVNSKDGLLIPRISGNNLKNKTYTYTEIGTLLYVTAKPDLANGQVSLIDSPGFYSLENPTASATPAPTSLRWTKLTTGMDKTDDEWVNATNLVKLGKKADGITDRDTNTDVVFTDNGFLGIGTSAPDSGIHIYDKSALSTNQFILESYASTPGSNFLFLSGALSSGQEINIRANETIGQFNFYGRVNGGFSNTHARITSTYRNTAGASLLFSAGGHSNPTLYLSESQKVGISTDSPRVELDINGAFAVEEYTITVSSGNWVIPEIRSSHISIIGNTPTNGYIALPTGVPGQRLVLVNNLSTNQNVTIYNSTTTNLTYLTPGQAKEFIYSNGSWRYSN